MFADPAIVKVMHGADSDVLWLQRDFGLFPVGLFDTGQAARVLELQGLGLAHLLQRHCNFKASHCARRTVPTPMNDGWRAVGSLWSAAVASAAPPYPA